MENHVGVLNISDYSKDCWHLKLLVHNFEDTGFAPIHFLSKVACVGVFNTAEEALISHSSMFVCSHHVPAGWLTISQSTFM
jgi:hypothetical protein